MDYLVIMGEGKVVEQGNPKDIIDEQTIQKFKLKVPELWNMWKAFPNAKTWDDLSEEIVKIYAN